MSCQKVVFIGQNGDVLTLPQIGITRIAVVDILTYSL